MPAELYKVGDGTGQAVIKPLPPSIKGRRKAAVLLVSAAMLSFAGWAAKQPLKRYGIRA